MGLSGSCTKALTPENPEDQNVKFIYPKYILDNFCAKKNHDALGIKNRREVCSCLRRWSW